MTNSTATNTTSDTNHVQTNAAEPELVTVPAITTAVVRGVVPMADMPSFFDASFSALVETVSAQQIDIAGPGFAYHYRRPSDTADLEIGFATDGAVRPEGDVVPSSLPAARVARLVHAGAFDGLPGSWQRLHNWIEEQGLTAGSAIWEVYVTEPTPDMDPADLRTELNWPVR